MKILQISGSGRNCGKTTLGCAILAAFPRLRWIAVKLTPHSYAEAATQSDNLVAGKDTERYLAAGAEQTFLLTSPLRVEFLAEAAKHTDGLLLESGQPVPVADFAVLHLAVAPDCPAFWKSEFLRRLAAGTPQQPDALVLHVDRDSAHKNTAFHPEMSHYLPVHLKIFPALKSALLTPALLDEVGRFLIGKVKG